MTTNPRQRLREFYDQALLTPELLCMNCSHTAWNRAGCICSESRRENCALFVSDMVNRLGQPVARGRRDASSSRPAMP